MDAALSSACNWLADHRRLTTAVLVSLIIIAGNLDTWWMS